MYTSEKTDRVIWQVMKTTGVPILGRTQVKLMNYISYPEICAPKDQEQSSVSVDSLKSTDNMYSLETTDSSLQSGKTVQSMDSLKTTPTTDQTAQEEYRAATRAKSTTAQGPKSPQVSWCKNAVTINVRLTLCPPPRSTYCMNMQTSSNGLELYQVAHTTYN